MVKAGWGSGPSSTINNKRIESCRHSCSTATDKLRLPPRLEFVPARRRQANTTSASADCKPVSGPPSPLALWCCSCR